MIPKIVQKGITTVYEFVRTTVCCLLSRAGLLRGKRSELR